ncbi:DUF72 domain-containing protein [Antarcticibacterium sp. 1MA-6-2]|uniref:DUF72 domain-containing protein n=1 Tax=Antarcticibacterium sp. 1MA-6-2 TaxID=2908210 RepID=UPI001F2743B5|nr:DUF72 domain-containing protein [Antarcticibacterium sp. 1MA-6-2]UJH93042.1 DUF72 domain-containing protein [Antarcticibacterium sp. 1MA-6-2]
MNNPPNYPYQFYGGLSGLQLPIPKYLFPPPYENASRLTFYSSHFNSIEFNSTFYKIPQPSTVAKWAASVPEDFRFSFKLWKGITHNKGLNFNDEDIVTFFNSVNSVNEKKGCLLIQFPPGLGREYRAQLKYLLSCIMELDPIQDWKIAVEFRNTSWYQDEVYDLLNFYKATVVIQDIPKSATPILDQDSKHLYLRFHGPTGNYRESYHEDCLRDYASLISQWKEEGKTIYAYFNNTMGDAFNNLKSLKDFVKH